jgi:hypothetical protein
LTLA